MIDTQKLSEFVIDLSQASLDPSTKVGAVIFDEDGDLIAGGFNRFPSNMENRPEWWNNRDEKYDRVVHAEIDALLSLPPTQIPHGMLITHAPCVDCAKVIAAAHIKIVYYLDVIERSSYKRALEILNDCGIYTECLKKPSGGGSFVH